MQSILIPIFKLTCTLANEIKEPKIDVQPEIFVANVTSATTITGARSIDGHEQKSKVMSLEFSIDYGIPIKRDLNKLTGYFDLEEVEIYLFKFQQKNFPDEVYMEKNHKPEKIRLPTRKDDLFGFSLYTALYIRERNYYKLKSGCQLISIYYDIGFGKTITIDKLSEALTNLHGLLNFKEMNDSKKCAFRFLVRLKNDPGAKVKVTEPLYSNMFRVVFDVEKYSVRTEEVDPLDYHIV